MKAATGQVRVNLYLPEKIHNTIRKVAKSRGITYSELYRTLLLNGLLQEQEAGRLKK